MNRIVTSLTALGLLAGAGLAQACTLNNWDDAQGSIVDGGPGEAPFLSRYQGLCGSRADADGSYVEALAAADEARMIQRFYFLAEGSGNATIYTAYSDEAGASPVFTVSYDGSNVTVTSNDGGTNAVAPVSGSANNWHSVEIDWTSNGAIELWVDSDALTAASDASGTSGAASTISSVRIGSQALGGFDAVNVDSYVSRRSSAIGRLLRGDATGDGAINIIDAVGIVSEIQSTPVSGQPDCTEDGSINIIDAVCVVGIIQGN